MFFFKEFGLLLAIFVTETHGSTCLYNNITDDINRFDNTYELIIVTCSMKTFIT